MSTVVVVSGHDRENTTTFPYADDAHGEMAIAHSHDGRGVLGMGGRAVAARLREVHRGGAPVFCTSMGLRAAHWANPGRLGARSCVSEPVVREPYAHGAGHSFGERPERVRERGACAAHAGRHALPGWSSIQRSKHLFRDAWVSELSSVRACKGAGKAGGQ